MLVMDHFDHKATTGDSGLDRKQSNWGAKLFIGTLFLILAFFWWLLIYSGGAAGHHG